MAESSEKLFSAKQVATRIGTDAKQLRKFFRDGASDFDAVGQGGRYEFPESQLPAIKKAFDAWAATKTRRNRAGSTTKATVPGQRKASPTPQAEEAPGWKRNLKEGLHGNALDGDDLSTRNTLGIRGRVMKHNLTVKQGRFVELPPAKGLTSASPQTIMTNAEVLEYDEAQGVDSIQEPPIGELQDIIDHLEREVGDNPGDFDDPDFDPADYAGFYDE